MNLAMPVNLIKTLEYRPLVTLDNLHEN